MREPEETRASVVVQSPGIRRAGSLSRRWLADRHCVVLLLGSLALASCSVPGSTPAPHAETGRWVAVLAPKDIPPDTYPPIEKTRRVKTFESFGDCENYRNQALADGAAMGSDAMLEEASSLRCIPEKAGPTTMPTK